ncbi:hypothetical protein KTT_11590 [Tengunoibacter tsumagoiensis]|uniref:Cell envelope-related transcriptional attenuator domain-containing protein n=2 Tax=Tengunoibacter tsumagoiensis TaxID=2014871 RepID=A0A401ZWY4_9CHLR|nr:hypothetical protein KTT_11590 [Tengunoibacter tsumagoiensis]
MTVPTGNDSTLSGKNRINILLLGSDTDGKQNDGVSGSPLAQTDIVVTIDKQSGYVGMLSVPRDLQVTIPGQGENKMDFAFRYGWQAGSGDFAGHAESAAGLAEDTLAYNFGIHIDHYAWVGLQGFVKVIDTAGGVDVDILHPIVEDNYPDDVNNPTGHNIDYKRLYFAPGPQHLNGTEALEYVRTRHSDLQGDFGRSARQQQVLNQLKMKLAQPEIIARASELLSELSGSVLTDMQPNDIIYLANLARGIDSNKIDRLTLSPPYSNPNEINTNYLPDCSQITPKISQMFDIQGTCLTQEVVGVSNDTSTVLPQATPTVTVTPSGSVSTPTSTPMSAPTPTIAPTLLPTPTPRSGRHNGL